MVYLLCFCKANKPQILELLCPLPLPSRFFIFFFIQTIIKLGTCVMHLVTLQVWLNPVQVSSKLSPTSFNRILCIYLLHFYSTLAPQRAFKAALDFKLIGLLPSGYKPSPSVSSPDNWKICSSPEVEVFLKDKICT